MGEAPTTPAAINLSRHIADCPKLFPEVRTTAFYTIVCLLIYALLNSGRRMLLLLGNSYAFLFMRDMVSSFPPFCGALP